MIFIYSKKKPGKLLHIVHRVSDFKEGRYEIVAPDNRIQCAALVMNKGKTFRPHIHIKSLQVLKQQAQESWVVVRGSVACVFYDIDGSFVSAHALNQGDASFTLDGGHKYNILEDNTLVYEYKTGPYRGQKKDKRFI